MEITRFVFEWFAGINCIILRSRRDKTKFATIKWYSLYLQIIQSHTCYPLNKWRGCYPLSLRDKSYHAVINCCHLFEYIYLYAPITLNESQRHALFHLFGLCRAAWNMKGNFKMKMHFSSGNRISDHSLSKLAPLIARPQHTLTDDKLFKKILTQLWHIWIKSTHNNSLF